MKAKSSKSEENTSLLKLLLDYISFERIQKSIERNMFLMKLNDLKYLFVQQRKPIWDSIEPKSEDNIKLCLANLKTFEEVRKLFLFETDVQIQLYFENFGLFYDALKKYHFAAYYKVEKKHDHALLCIERARKVLAEIQIEQLSNEDAFKMRFDLEELDLLLVRLECKLVAECYMKGGTVGQVVDKVDLLRLVQPSLYFDLDRFQCFQSVPKIVGLEPVPVPMRPIVYDLAYSQIEFPIKNLERIANGLAPFESGQESEGQKSFLKGVFGIWK
jgi:signal recognition particle subunit SRP68